MRIVGGLGHDQLFLNDESSSHPNGVHTLRATKYEKTASDTETEIEFFTVNEIELSTGASAEIVHVRGTSQYTHDLRVDMGNSDDQVNIHRTHENTHLYVDLGGGSDLVELSPNTRDLDSIGGTVEVNMRYGANDRILLNDDLDAGEDYYNLWMSRFDKTGFSELVFDNADVVDLRANADENIINIRELHQDVDLNVHAGGGDDSIRVGTVHYDLDSYLPGGLSLEGGAGRDLAVFYDQSDTGSDAYRISATEFSKTGTQEWPIASVEVLTLNANEYTNHVHVGAIDGATDRLNINVRGGDDEIFLGTIYNRLDQLQGEIVVNGGIGLNKIHALDSRSGGPRAYTFEDETFDTSGSFGTLDFRSIASLRVIADDYDDEFHVRSLNATTDLDLRGSDGDDQVQLVDVLNDLSSVIAFAGGAGTDRIHIDDSLAFTGQSYNLNASAFHRGNGLSVEFDENLELLDLNGTAHVDLFRVLSAPLGSIPIQVDLAGGRNVVFGPNEVSDWRVRDLNSVRFGANVEFLGTEEVVGGNAVDNFVVLPGALQSDSTPVTVNGGVGSSIDVLTTPSSVRAEVSLEDGTINDVLSFSGVERLRGNHHNDRLTGKNVENVWRVSGSNSGSIQTAGQSDTVRFTNFESLLGGTETDRFLLQEGGSISGPINGRQGRDWIDYRNRTSGVFVDLSGDLATDIGTPVSIENVHGGQGRDLIVGDEKRNILRGEAGHDVLVGMKGNDLIFGDDGRDVMIGGLGPDQLYGFSGEDILIGGWTGYDSSASDLNTLSEIWSNPNSVFEVRVEQLHNGKGGVEVSKETVTDDGQVDQLFGQGDMDWLWEGVGDELVQDGRTAGPTLNSSQSSSAEDQQLAALASGVFVVVDSTSDEILFAQDRFPSEAGLDSGLGNLASFSWTNASNRFDVNDDDAITPLDALLIINFLNRSSGLLPELSQQPSEFLDVSQDGHATPLDALAVINQLNKRKDSVFFAESEDEEDSQERL